MSVRWRVVGGSSFVAGLMMLHGCSSSSSGSSNTGDGGTTNGNPPTSSAAPPPGGGAAPAGTTTLPLSNAPPLGTVNFAPDRSSVKLFVPGVSGAVDYRVFAVKDGIAVAVDAKQREHIGGATIYCGGLAQRNQCSKAEDFPLSYGNEKACGGGQQSCFTMPDCTEDTREPDVPKALNQELEINGLSGSTTLVVEALDRQCPFAGVVGHTHQDVKVDTASADIPKTATATVNGASVSLQVLPTTVPIRTEAEITADYGSMVFNGQGPNLPSFDTSASGFTPQSPWIHIGNPAPADDPVVLARAVIVVTTAPNVPPTGFAATDTFDGFDDPSDQPVLVAARGNIPSFLENGDTTVTTAARFQTKNWNLYSIGSFDNYDFFTDRGVLHSVLSDPSQDSMVSLAIYPKRAVQLPTAADTYLHTTYEVQTHESDRRYINFTLCGAATAGATYVGDHPATAPIPQPGFMNGPQLDPTGTQVGRRSSPLGWNCLLLVPRGQGYGVLADTNLRSDTSMLVGVLNAEPAPSSQAVYQGTSPTPSLVNNFGPKQGTPSQQDDTYGHNAWWERAINDSQGMSGPWLDDHHDVWDRTQFDVFVRRDKVVVYVAGQQRLCQTISGITMAEGAIGLWQVLYHTSAEWLESRSSGITGIHHIMHNTPFTDERTWDNVGFQENVTLPSDFDAKKCL